MEANGKSNLLQRALGAVVLIAAAATLIPLLLDGRGMKVAREQVQIPEEPTFELRLNDDQQPQVRLLETKGAISRAEQESQDAVTAGTDDAAETMSAAQAEMAANSVAEPEPAKPEVTLPANAQSAALPAEPTAAGQQSMEDVIQKITLNESVAAPKAAVPDNTPKPVALGADVADSWTIQMGAFKDRGNAEKSVAQLVSRGYRAYLGTQTPGVFRVFVGPEIRRDRADQLRDRVAADTGSRGVVVRYLP